MKIGVVSDTHNNLKNIETIINLFNDEKVSLVIHTGDISNANSLEKFSQLKCELIGVYGNNDRNELGIKEVASKNNFNFQEPPRKLSLGDREIAIFHEPDNIENNTPEDDMGYRILIEIVKSLKPPKPEIVEKTALGYTRVQIADELGMGVTTVTDHLAAAKKQIEEIYYE